MMCNAARLMYAANVKRLDRLAFELVAIILVFNG